MSIQKTKPREVGEKKRKKMKKKPLIIRAESQAGDKHVREAIAKTLISPSQRPVNKDVLIEIERTLKKTEINFNFST